MLVRGLPGSGKSTLAKLLLANRTSLSPKETAVHLEADMFLTNEKGDYTWTFEKFKQAHNWCFQKTREAMEKGSQFIVVSNCFVHKSSMARYLSAAEVMGYKTDIIVLNSKYEGVHPIPPHIYDSMKKHWEN
jgi:predicted kinase